MTAKDRDASPQRPRLSRRLQQRAERVARQARARSDLVREQLAAVEAERRDLAESPTLDEAQQLRLAELGDVAEELTGRLRALKREALLPHAYPGNPTGIFAGGLIQGGDTTRPMLANRIYLDVTDATLEQVKEVWEIVEYAKERRRERGLSTSKPRGAPQGPRKGGEVDRWVKRVRAIGWDAAYAEFKAETPTERGAWATRARWWERNIEKYVPKMR